MSYVTSIHAKDYGWVMLGFHSDPGIAAEQESEAKAAVEAGEWQGHAVDAYRVVRADMSDFWMD